MRLPPAASAPESGGDAALREYNAARATNGQRPVTGRGARIAMAAVAAWCRLRGADPARYVRDRMMREGHSHPIPIKQLVNERFLGTHLTVGARLRAAEDGQAALAAAAVEDLPKWGAELNVLAEAVKAAHVSDREVCRHLSRDSTLGWNGASRHCATCPQADPCAAALPPEALRARRK